MERIDISPSEVLHSFIESNHLIHTDPRYSVGDGRRVLDVVQYVREKVDSHDEEYKRLLLIEEGYEKSTEHFWNVLADASESFILPIKQEIDYKGLVVYEIPLSLRLLIHETKKYKNEAQNRMNNERLASSLGKLVKAFADVTGNYVDPATVEARSAFIDFVDEETQPVLLMAPVVYRTHNQGIKDFYSEMFDYDLSFKKPFIESLES